MMRQLYLIGWLLSLSHWTTAQSNNQNYVLTRTYKVRAATEATGISYNGTPNQVATQVAYFDGLGQPIQQIAAFAGNIGQDLMTRTVHDVYGRPSQTFAPVAAPGNNGGLVSNPIGTYYNSSEVCSPTANYYDQSVYESSPLNRPTEQRAIGITTGVRTTYQTNTANSVIRYQVSGANLRDLGVNGYYAANTLTLTEIKDENNTTTQTFQDSEKRVVLRRMVLSTENLDTYYVYDEPGQLRFVLQPQFQLEGNLDRFAFMYQYNNRGLVIRKKVPGAGEQTMLYDSRDRLSSLTDARGIIFTHQYDDLNRPAQVLVNNNIPIQYTYYDNYGFSLFANGGFVNELGLNATDHFVSNPQSESRKGLMTGQLVRLLNASGGYDNWYQTVFYYDNRNRLIQQNRQLFGLSGSAYERISYQYDFAGKRVLERTTQYTGSITYRIDKAFSYDQADRLTQVQHTVYENGVLVKSYEHSRQTYNQVGLLASEEWNTGNLGQLYKYSARGWLCEQQSTKGPGFSHTLQYHPNGNVQSMSVSTNGQYSGTRSFTYDLANRLTATSGSGSLGGFDENNISYDRNGNIKTLNRTWNGQLIDQLSYFYTGNQVHRIGDGGNNALAEKGFANATDYDNELQYDANGNLTSDANRAINAISYNVLNLPRQVNVGANYVQYDYDALGRKRRMTGPGGVATTYEGDFEYNANGTLMRIGLEEGQLVRNSSGVYSVQYYYRDHLGNVRQVVSDNGAVVQQTEYYGFGLAVFRQGDVNTNKYLYNGKEQQLQTPWLDYGARMYDPTIGRWSVVDPLADVEPGLTPYRYAYNNPVLVTDPDGMFEYSDGYSTQNSKYSTGSMEFSGTYQDAGDGPGKRDNPASSKKKDKVSGPLLSESGQPINPDGSAYFDPGDRTNAWLFAADKRDEDDPTRIIDNLITLFSPTKVLGGLGLLSKSNPGSKIVAAKQLAGRLKSISSLESQIAKHQSKLDEYIKDPMKFDNKGFLKNAPNDAVRQKIVESRINHLKQEIQIFKNNIQKIINNE